MRILGVDPGLRATGFGLVEVKTGPVKIIDAGSIEPNPKALFEDRIAKVHSLLSEIISTHKPNVLVLEKLYAHYKHPTTACLLGHVRGVICLLAHQHKIELVEQPVKRIRLALVGNGNATKEQVQMFIKRLLKIESSKMTLDTSDALALALGHAHMMKFKLMIASIKGKIRERLDNAVIVDTGALSYEVLVPVSVSQRLQENEDSDGNVRFITYHYLQVTNSSANEILVGFLNEIERDFFLEFIKVSGIGPRAAVKALNKSIGEIAQAIDRGDTKYLKGLPGIGEQKAKEIVAKLQGKMGKFTLMRDHVAVPKPDTDLRDIEQEALHVLLQLQYKKPEAEDMIGKALERNKKIATAEELLNEIYKQRKV